MIKYKTQIPQVYLARESTSFPKCKIMTSKDVIQFIIENCIYNNTMTVQEELWVIYMNLANNIIGITQTGVGSDMGVIGSVKKIFTTGMLLFATSLIVFHNHPSGNLIPSEADNILCKKIKEAGIIMEIRLTDFIIITEDSHLSFADDGLL